MSDPPNSLPAVVRHMRIVWSALLFSQFLYMLVASMIYRTASLTVPAQSIIIGVATVAVCTLGILLMYRLKFIRRASESLQSDPTDVAAIARWRKLQITTMIIAETLTLYGYLLLATGAPLNQVVPFYVAGLAAMLFVFPQNPAS